jgi:hypothetical protein
MKDPNITCNQSISYSFTSWTSRIEAPWNDSLVFRVAKQVLRWNLGMFKGAKKTNKLLNKHTETGVEPCKTATTSMYVGDAAWQTLYWSAYLKKEVYHMLEQTVNVCVCATFEWMQHFLSSLACPPLRPFVYIYIINVNIKHHIIEHHRLIYIHIINKI